MLARPVGRDAVPADSGVDVADPLDPKEIDVHGDGSVGQTCIAGIMARINGEDDELTIDALLDQLMDFAATPESDSDTTQGEHHLSGRYHESRSTMPAGHAHKVSPRFAADPRAGSVHGPSAVSQTGARVFAHCADPAPAAWDRVACNGGALDDHGMGTARLHALGYNSLSIGDGAESPHAGRSWNVGEHPWADMSHPLHTHGTPSERSLVRVYGEEQYLGGHYGQDIDADVVGHTGHDDYLRAPPSDDDDDDDDGDDRDGDGESLYRRQHGGGAHRPHWDSFMASVPPHLVPYYQDQRHHPMAVTRVLEGAVHCLESRICDAYRRPHDPHGFSDDRSHLAGDRQSAYRECDRYRHASPMTAGPTDTPTAYTPGVVSPRSFDALPSASTPTPSYDSIPTLGQHQSRWTASSLAVESSDLFMPSDLLAPDHAHDTNALWFNHERGRYAQCAPPNVTGRSETAHASSFLMARRASVPSTLGGVPDHRQGPMRSGVCVPPAVAPQTRTDLMEPSSIPATYRGHASRTAAAEAARDGRRVSISGPCTASYVGSALVPCAKRHPLSLSRASFVPIVHGSPTDTGLCDAARTLRSMLPGHTEQRATIDPTRPRVIVPTRGALSRTLPPAPKMSATATMIHNEIHKHKARTGAVTRSMAPTKETLLAEAAPVPETAPGRGSDPAERKHRKRARSQHTKQRRAKRTPKAGKKGAKRPRSNTDPSRRSEVDRALKVAVDERTFKCHVIRAGDFIAANVPRWPPAQCRTQHTSSVPANASTDPSAPADMAKLGRPISWLGPCRALAAICKAWGLLVPVDGDPQRAFHEMATLLRAMTRHDAVDARRPADPDGTVRVGWVPLMGNHGVLPSAAHVSPLWTGVVLPLAASGMSLLAPQEEVTDRPGERPAERTMRILCTEAGMPWFVARVRRMINDVVLGVAPCDAQGQQQQQQQSLDNLFEDMTIDVYVEARLDAHLQVRPYDVYIVPRVDLYPDVLTAAAAAAAAAAMV